MPYSNGRLSLNNQRVLVTGASRGLGAEIASEVGAFYWTDMAPDIVNPGREEQGSVSV
jgi:NAD(P)-dependent dehydrogenase (short-subunit alcohol dehydrogenase family)